MDQEILKKFDELTQKLDAVYRSTERMRKNFLWTLRITVILIVLPLIGLLFAIPAFLRTFSDIGL